MTKKELKELASNVKNGLKDFQLATVEQVYHQFYEKNLSRFLVADEVGLGKTIVAKGLIARAAIDALNKNENLRVVYICSNQALTGQNLKKLNFTGNTEVVEDKSGRLIFLALKDKKLDNDFHLSSLTPSTSFDLVKGLGQREERMLIWLILTHYQVFSSGKRKERLSLFLQGSVSKWKNWWKECKEYERCRECIRNKKRKLCKNCKRNSIRTRLPLKFKDAIESEMINLDKTNRYQSIREETKLSGKVRLRDIISAYIDKDWFSRKDKYEGPKKVIGLLRKILTRICLEYLDADIFILDEFQKFKSLIETGNEGELSEAGETARIVFGKENAKVLMLSATPFKPFGTNVEVEQGDNNFEEFKEVLRFLFEKNMTKISEIEEARKLHFNILRQPSAFTEDKIKHKKKLEKRYREVMARTERNLVSDDKNTLLKLRTDLQTTFEPEDLENFIKSDELIEALEGKRSRKMISMVEFSKSAPYPLSFLDGYKIREDLKEFRNDLTPELEASRSAWLDSSKLQDYKKVDYPNSRMRLLHKEAFQLKMELKLWLAPSTSYYEIRSKAYGKDTTNSKILVFSKWKMVPRAISSLTSYEAERRTIGKLTTEIKYNTENADGGKSVARKPRPRLSLKKKENSASSMSVFSLIYPSIYLAKVINLQENAFLEVPLNATTLIDKLAIKIKADFKRKNLSSFTQKDGLSKRWYWAAPILLDTYFHEEVQYEWLKNIKHTSSQFLKHKGRKDDKKNKASNQTAKLHLDELREGLEDEKAFGLGQVPDDLFKVLAKQALAAPAVCFLRMMQTYFKKPSQTSELMTYSLDAGSHFTSLFDKPESIAIVDICSTSKRKQEDFYWENVLDYCLEGNLQSVLDEFGHLVYPDHLDAGNFSSRIYNSININTSSLKVDDAESFTSGKNNTMRCHYAVDFGNQKMEDDAGRNRIVSVLNNFNSPFRPFVLATTSVGQEGLDFHLYCRKVMHWNLPSNPVDLEQREGRVNRYKGLVVRQNIISKYLKSIDPNQDADLWNLLFDFAESKEKSGKSKLEKNKCDLVPYWHVESNGIHIDRIVPELPYSKEHYRYQQLIKALTYYRLTFGQPRQEELLKSLTQFADSEENIKLLNTLFIDLSPINYGEGEC